MRLLLAMIILGFVAFSASGARAQTCVSSISNVNFGSPNIIAAISVDTTATLQVVCSNLGAQTIQICASLGAGSGGASGGSRSMTGTNSGTLLYNLYQDSSRSLQWGSSSDASLGTVPSFSLISVNNSPVSASYTIYARLASAQNTQPPGNYSSSFSSSDDTVRYRHGNSCAGSQVAPQDQPTFTVSASPQDYCKITVSDLSFGSKGILDAAVDASSPLAVTCTKSTPYSISLDNGLTGSSPDARRMTRGTEFVTYGLYSDAARAQLWGSTSNGAARSGVGTGLGQNSTVYGRTIIQRTPSVGAYSDSIVATIQY
jgi:spore coat protein U-like protein